MIKRLLVQVKNTCERFVSELLWKISIQRILFDIITYTFVSDLKQFIRIWRQKLRALSYKLVVLAYENPELLYRLCVLLVVRIFLLVLLRIIIILIYEMSQNWWIFFRKFIDKIDRNNSSIYHYIDELFRSIHSTFIYYIYYKILFSIKFYFSFELL